MLLISVLSMNPTESSIVLFLHEHASHPKILICMTLIIKAIFFLSQVNAALSLFKDGKGPYGNSVVL